MTNLLDKVAGKTKQVVAAVTVARQRPLPEKLIAKTRSLFVACPRHSGNFFQDSMPMCGSNFHECIDGEQ